MSTKNITYLLLIIISIVNVAFSQQETAEGVEFSMSDDNGDLVWLIKASRIESKFDVRIDGLDKYFEGYYIENLLLYLPQLIDNEKRIFLVRAEKAYYVGAIQRLEIWDDASLFLLSPKSDSTLTVKSKNQIKDWLFKISTKKLTVLLNQKTTSESNQSAEKSNSPNQFKIYTNENIVLLYPEKDVTFIAEGFSMIQEIPVINLHGNISGKYGTTQRLNIRSQNIEEAERIELKALRGGKIIFTDFEKFELEKIELSGAVILSSTVENIKLLCSKIYINFTRDVHSLGINRIIAKDNVRFFVPDLFNVFCGKLEFIMEDNEVDENVWCNFSQIRKANIYEQNSSLFFNQRSTEISQYEGFYSCYASDKITFNRRFNKLSHDEVPGSESWRFIKNALIEHTTLKLDPTKVKNLNKNPYDDKLLDKSKSDLISQKDATMHGKEDILLYFELRRKRSIVDNTFLPINRILTRMDVNNPGTQTTLEFNIEELGNFRIAATQMSFVKKSDLESQISIHSETPQIIWRTEQNLNLFMTANPAGTIFRYQLSSQNSIFLKLLYESNYQSFEMLEFNSKGPVLLTKTPFRLKEKSKPEYFASMSTGELLAQFRANPKNKLELTKLVAKAYEKNKIIFEADENNISMDFLIYELKKQNYDVNIPIDIMPNWKNYYSTWVYNLSIKGEVTFNSTNERICKFFEIDENYNSDAVCNIPDSINLKCDDSLIYSCKLLRSSNLDMILEQGLSVDNKIEVNASAENISILSFTCNKIRTKTIKSWETNDQAVSEFSCQGDSLKSPAYFIYEVRGIRFEAYKIFVVRNTKSSELRKQKNNSEDSKTVSDKNYLDITLSGSPKIEIIVNPDEIASSKNESLNFNNSKLRISISFPLTNVEKELAKQQIKINGLIKNIDISPRSKIEVAQLTSEQNSEDNQTEENRKARNSTDSIKFLTLTADLLNINFKNDDGENSPISLEIADLSAKGNVVFFDGEKTLNGDAFVWENSEYLRAELSGKNSILREVKNGKTTYIISGINNYQFFEKNEKNPNRKNSFRIRAKKGIKFRMR